VDVELIEFVNRYPGDCFGLRFLCRELAANRPGAYADTEQLALSIRLASTLPSVSVSRGSALPASTRTSPADTARSWPDRIVTHEIVEAIDP
jgi:hypothetical protein